MSAVNISELLQRPEPRVKVTPLQFLRVFERVFREELDRVGLFADDAINVERAMNFNKRSSQLQLWQKVEKEGLREFKMVLTIDAQIIPQKDSLNAINYSLWHLPTDNQARYLSIMEELESVPGEAARAVVVCFSMLDSEYKPTDPIKELTDTSVKSQRGISFTDDLTAAARRGGGAATTDQAQDILGVNQ